MALGQIKNYKLRLKIFNKLKKLKFKIPIIESPNSYVSKNSKIGEGTMVFNGVIVNSNVKIGKNCIINSRALIEHDVKIGNNCHISTGSILNGNVEIGDNCFIGSGSILRNGIKIKKFFYSNGVKNLQMTKKTFIIAEAGINHNGSLKNAIKLIRFAKSAGADAVKFQSFIPDLVVIKNLELANYQKSNNSKIKKMFHMLEKYKISEKGQFKLANYCKKIKIEFMSSAFDMRSLDFLLNKINIKTIKIPSGEITNFPYLVKVAKSKKK